MFILAKSAYKCPHYQGSIAPGPLGITGERWRRAGLSYSAMSDEQPRTGASSRERSPDHQYSLSIDQTAELYAKAGYPRTIRAIQKYCALSKLDCHKVETDTGEKYLVAPYSVERHIAYINEVRTVATSRDQTRMDASVRAMENNDENKTNGREQSRTDPGVRREDDRYVSQLEKENEFMRGQIVVKDTQIADLLKNGEKTNEIIHRLQSIIVLLPPAAERRGQYAPRDEEETTPQV